MCSNSQCSNTGGMNEGLACHVPYTVQEVCVVICIHKEVVSYFVVQHGVTVLEVIQHTHNGAVLVIR